MMMSLHRIDKKYISFLRPFDNLGRVNGEASLRAETRPFVKTGFSSNGLEYYAPIYLQWQGFKTHEKPVQENIYTLPINDCEDGLICFANALPVGNPEVLLNFFIQEHYTLGKRQDAFVDYNQALIANKMYMLHKFRAEKRLGKITPMINYFSKLETVAGKFDSSKTIKEMHDELFMSGNRR